MRSIKFTKTSGKFDQVAFVVENKIICQIENPKQRILPHDMIHTIVEKQFGIRGFIDLVFEGQSPYAAMAPDGEAWLSESMVESLQGMLWSGAMDLAQFNSWIESICEQRKVPFKKFTAQEFESLRLAIETASKKWELVQIGESVELEWH